MANVLLTGLGALLTSQRALATTGHNIANMNTPGFSRQRVELATQRAQDFGAGFIGNGVQMTGVSRSYDMFLAAELRGNESAFNRLDAFYGMSARLDGLLADESAGVAPGIQAFFAAAQDVASDPASLPARQALLSQADGVADRFARLDGHFDSMEREISGRLRQEVADIDGLAKSIADVNQRIVAATGASGGAAPNDLLDHRDQLIGELAGKINVSTVAQSDGALNVYVGNGQSLVNGNMATSLSVRRDALNPERANVVIDNGITQTDISASMSGGTVGGLMDFRREALDPARNEVGRIAVAFATAINEQHAAGMDMNGDLGGAFFDIAGPRILPASGNTGSGVISASLTDVGALSGDDYVLSFSAGAYSLNRADTGEPVTMSGSGTAADPFVADGISIVTGGAAADGDRFLVQPTAAAAGSLTNLIGSPQQVAAAGPVRTATNAANIGSASISAGEVIDASDPLLLSPSVIEFTSPTTYSINGAGSFAYTAGDPIDINGVRVEIDGEPLAGDRFELAPNNGGLGDNRNMLALGDVQSRGVLDGGTASLTSAVGTLVAEVGTATRHASSSLAAQGVLLEQSLIQQQSVSGVNLDEEAANMLRYQQSYEAAAQIITVANSMFNSILNAVRR